MIDKTKLIKKLVVDSATMALEAYGDLKYEDNNKQLTVDEKADIIRSNEDSWFKRVLENTLTK